MMMHSYDMLVNTAALLMLICLLYFTIKNLLHL